MKREDVPSGVMSLLKRLKTYTVDWKFSFVPTEDEEYEAGTDRGEAPLDEANVVSSELRFPTLFLTDEPRHMVALDIDHEAWLIPSSTCGHSHLYIRVPDGIGHADYMELLEVLAKCGVIERGYAQVSIARGHSDLRLPWVSKADQKLHNDQEAFA